MAAQVRASDIFSGQNEKPLKVAAQVLASDILSGQNENPLRVAAQVRSSDILSGQNEKPLVRPASWGNESEGHAPIGSVPRHLLGGRPNATQA
ncbi:MAG: hypothetical protein HKN03_19350, partial [Acidimicrobiales bacterium]|nr:hypothetical protein [Acidimicrobiales bacterium]